jgi:hypothetical protein
VLTEIERASELLIDLEEAKQALRVDHDDDDGRIEALIRSETARFEAFARRRLVKVTLEASFLDFAEPIVLPVSPVRSIVELAYLDAQHARQTVAGSSYYTTTTAIGETEIRFASGWIAPALSDRPRPVFVQFEAGLDSPDATGADPAFLLEERDKICILQLVASLYDHGKSMTEADMRATMGDRRLFR